MTFRPLGVIVLIGMVAAATGAIAQDPFPLGEARDDLGRFYGIYGDPDDDTGRDFFVAPARRPEYAESQLPDGYLMVGAMWGDVAPWYMKSVTDTRFVQAWTNPGAKPVIVEFETGAKGEAQALEFGSVLEDFGRLERLDDLPENW